MKHRSSIIPTKSLNYPRSGAISLLVRFSKIMEYRKGFFYLKYASTNQYSMPWKFTVYLDPNPQATFHLVGWKQNMKAVKSNVVKY